MRIGFMVNDVRTEEASYTTTRLAMQATNMGHETWHIGAGDFAYDTDERTHAYAKGPTKTSYKSLAAFLAEVQGPKARIENITVDDLGRPRPRLSAASHTADPRQVAFPLTGSAQLALRQDLSGVVDRDRGESRRDIVGSRAPQAALYEAREPEQRWAQVPADHAPMSVPQHL